VTAGAAPVWTDPAEAAGTLGMVLSEPFDVVLVDDAADVRSLIGWRLKLSRRFVVVGEGGTGQEAITLAAAHQPDLVVLDASMPGMDGLEALPAILRAAPSTKVVMFSGFEGSSLADAALALGASAFIEKAMPIEDLPDRLLDVLGAAGPGEGVAGDGSAVAAGAEVSSGHRPAPDAERVLAEHLERFRTVFDQAAIGMATLTLAGTVVRANRALSLLLGESEEALIGRRYSSLVGPDSSRLLEQALGDATRGVEAAYVDHSLAGGGALRWAHSTLAAVRDTGGKPLYLFAQMQDVTAQRQALAELQASEERFRLLVEGVGEYAIFMLDPTGCVTTWNPGAERMKGYRAGEIIGRHFSVFYPAEAQRQHHPQDELEIALRDGRYEEEGWRVRKDGTRFWANVVITPVYDGGSHVGFAKVTRDVTERRASTEARERAAAELAEANDELRVAAEKTAEFVAVTAHELQSPIAAITGATSILTGFWEDMDRAQREETLQSIGKASSRISRLLADLLTASRLETGAFEYSFEDIDLSSVLDEVLTEVAPVAAVVASCPPGITVRADRSRVVQILTNLVSNAGKYGRPPILVDTGVDGSCAQIRVIDSGPGVPEDLVPRLFEKFARAGGLVERGAGLGLFIVRQLARGQHGDARYGRDDLGRPCFTVTLPLATRG
jgi:PAS domain S-box-containing protein